MNDVFQTCDPEHEGPTCAAEPPRVMVPLPDVPEVYGFHRSRKKLPLEPTPTFTFRMDEDAWATKPWYCRCRGNGVHPINPTVAWNPQ